MKTMKLFALFVIPALILTGCTKHDDEASVFAGKPLLNRVDDGVGQYYLFLYDGGQLLSGIRRWTGVTSYPFLDFTYAGTQLSWIPSQGSQVYGQSIYYDVNNLAASATLRNAPYASSGKGQTQETDSIIFKNDNGKVSYKAYFGIFKNITNYAFNPPNYTAFIPDSFIIYRMSYANGNIAKIRSEFKNSGSIVEEEFTWGTRKGIFSNIEPLPVVCPEYTTSYGFFFMSLLCKNELVNYTRTYVNENNRKVIFNYEYQYNKYGYAESVIQTESGTNNSTHKMDLSYQ